jgi:glycosyltransferase involved in cell wall biosynthesis
LVSVIENTSDEEMKAMAEKSLALAQKELTWKRIGEQYSEVFDN